MPTSHAQQLNEIVGLIHAVNPQTLLDIGCGKGKYGLLAREYLELWGEGGERRIDAVEVFPDYLTDVQRAIYNNIYIGNVLEVLPRHPYDLYLLIDVLEHFTQEDGHRLLDMCEGDIIVSTPKEFESQEAVFGNEHERHLSVWSVSDLMQHGTVRSVPNERSVICLIRKVKA